MKRASIASLLALFLAAGCSHQQDLTRASSQDNFGVQAARMNLWREALFRFQRAVQINPEDAMAHSNLAVAWEANGNFESARAEYLLALKIDKSNPYIQKNYSRFVEFLSKNKKRQKGGAPPPKSAATPPPMVNMPSAGVSAPPPMPGGPVPDTTPLIPPPPRPPGGQQ